MCDQLTIEEAVPEINRRFVVCSTVELGLYGYQLYVEGEVMRERVLDTTLTEVEVHEFRAAEVDVERHPNRVFMRALARIEKSAKT